jgi:hypothetical protein
MSEKYVSLGGHCHDYIRRILTHIPPNYRHSRPVSQLRRPLPRLYPANTNTHTSLVQFCDMGQTLYEAAGVVAGWTTQDVVGVDTGGLRDT